MFKIGIEVGKDLSLKELRAQGFEAFYLAIGAQAGRKLDIKGEKSLFGCNRRYIKYYCHNRLDWYCY